MMDTDAAPTCDALTPEAATGAATVAAPGRMRPEWIEVVLSSDHRLEHDPEPQARLVAEMMS